MFVIFNDTNARKFWSIIKVNFSFSSWLMSFIWTIINDKHFPSKRKNFFISFYVRLLDFHILCLFIRFHFDWQFWNDCQIKICHQIFFGSYFFFVNKRIRRRKRSKNQIQILSFRLKWDFQLYFHFSAIRWLVIVLQHSKSNALVGMDLFCWKIEFSTCENCHIRWHTLITDHTG